MKTSSVVLLVVALCVERASSLHCFTCENAKSHDECKSVRCSDMEKHCVLLTTQKSGGPLFINKWCAGSCPSQYDTKSGNEKIEIECCQENNCNSGASVSVKTSGAVMVMAVLASFSYILRTGL